ncbi:MAG: hypothetical protein R3A52_10075 [Polyangiales bacterium]
MRLPLVLGLLSLACASRPEPAPAPPAHRANAPRRDDVSPVTVAWIGPATPPASGPLQLTARVTRNVPFDLPVTVTVRAPRGATLSTAPRWEIPVGPADALDAPVVIAYPSVPTGDLVLVAEARDDAHGVYATARYHFGRSEPERSPPPVTSRALSVGGARMGPSVDMGAQR